jgi:hypothetical protein
LSSVGRRAICDAAGRKRSAKKPFGGNMPAPSWMQQREELLQQACNCITEEVQGGTRIGRAIADAARKFVNVPLGDGRRLALSPRTLEGIWARYKKVGPEAFQLKYSGDTSLACKRSQPQSPDLCSQRGTIDPILLGLVVEHVLQTGASLEEAIESIQPANVAQLTIKQIYQAVPKRPLDTLSRTHRALLKRRTKLENAFRRSDAAIRRRFLKGRAELQRRMLHTDEMLQRRLVSQREMLQKKFLAADAAAVKRREKLQGKTLRAMLRPLP